MKKSAFTNLSRITLSLVLLLGSTLPASRLYSFDKVLVQNREQYKKRIRTRMPPQLILETLEENFNSSSDKWETSWQNFIVEDKEDGKEFLFIARSVEKPWALAVIKDDCAKPENFEKLKTDVQSGGTPVRMDVIIGIKKRRSWFRYNVNVYKPMYPFWKNGCYSWNLPPGTSRDEFYQENYNMPVYSENMQKKVYKLVSRLKKWKPPKNITKIPAMKGPGHELIGGGVDELLTDEEKLLPVKKQERIIRKRLKRIEKERKKKERIKRKKTMRKR